jgi:hypothetical protein
MMNATAAPTAATIAPPIAGPRLRARLKPTALAMTAGAIWERGTWSPIDACHAGANAAAPHPIRNVSPSSSDGVMVRPGDEREPRTSRARTCETSMIARRSRVSAATSDRKKYGSVFAAGRRHLVRSWRDRGHEPQAPTVWIMLPNDDARGPPEQREGAMLGASVPSPALEPR